MNIRDCVSDDLHYDCSPGFKCALVVVMFEQLKNLWLNITEIQNGRPPFLKQI